MTFSAKADNKRRQIQFDIITLFPQMFSSVFSESLVKKALEKNFLKINLINLRDFASDKHKTVDDKPYGGSVGMIFKVDILAKAIRSRKKISKKVKIILLSPQGKIFTQKKAKELSKFDQIILICGHYGGVDERIKKFIDEEISIGDYILTGGEIPAIVLIDSVTRLIPKVVGNQSSLAEESLEKNLLKYPQYTKPAEFEGFKVPKILLSGDHKKIESWQQQKSLEKTKKLRPDLLKFKS